MKRLAQMIEPSKHIHPETPREGNGADERERLRGEMLALITTGMKAAASRVIETLQQPANDEQLA